MSITNEEYAEFVEQLLAILGQKHASGEDIEMSLCVCGLELQRDNKKIRDYVVRTLKLKAADFDRAMRIEHAKAELGEYPATASRFVEMMAARMNLTAQYNGVLRKAGIPYLDMEDGRRQPIDPDLWDNDDFRLLVTTKFHRVTSFDEFARDVRITAVEYGLPFRVENLNDLCENWYHSATNERLWMIARDIEYTDSKMIREAGQASLRRLAETCFECPHGTAFVVAVFNKFIWQVKRKINQLPVYDHLMPVILGPQGAGKSTLIRLMLAAIEELWVTTDFKQITDDRNISIWRNFVIFLDEMGWASKSDMDSVKHIVSAVNLTRRVMRTNITQEVAQNATFIGAANADELADLIRDSATRRFVSLDMLATPDREVINSIDWRAVWQSVDHRASDPMAPFKAVLQTAQANDRTVTSVETWLGSLTPQSVIGGRVHKPKDTFTSSELFLDFAEYAKTYCADVKPISINGFGRQMKHLCNNPRSQFVRDEDQSRAVFQWREPARTKSA